MALGNFYLGKGVLLLDYRGAVAAVVDALNADRTEIGDPRKGDYGVRFVVATVREAIDLARNLARIGIVPKTTIEHDEFGNLAFVRVVVWPYADHERLLKVSEAQHEPGRRQQLDDLVRARGPISDELLEWIWAHQRGRSSAWIADTLNKGDRIGGMGGKSWTRQKVDKRVAEAKERWQPQAEVA